MAVTHKEFLDYAKGWIGIIMFLLGGAVGYATYYAQEQLIKSDVQTLKEGQKELKDQQLEQYKINGAVLQFIENDNNHD